jgi:hypothetical protein
MGKIMSANTVKAVISENFDEGQDVSTGRADAPGGGQYAQFRRALSAATAPRWQAETLARVTALLKMRAGWDSYRALPVRHDAAMFALTILENVMRSSTPSPSVIPSASGGLQLEWHVNDIDLEIHVLEPYKGEVWWYDHSTGGESTHELTADLSTLRAPISKLTVS